ncbi:uncharacterized protein CBL_04485 [Carabus blaptoides fortunei]
MGHNNNHTTLNSSSSESLHSRLQMSTEFFLVPRTTTTSTARPPVSSIITSKTGAGAGVRRVTATSVFRTEAWVAPVLTLAALCMLLIVGFELFVICKTWRATPSRRHLFLGQMLLLGLFACACVGAAVALAPTPFTCGVVRLGAGLAYTVVFSALLVKCVFLISLNGGVYLPAAYQALLLLFACLIQLAIGVQWLLDTPPQVVHTGGVVPRHRLLVTVNDVGIDTTSTTNTAAASVPLCSTPFTHMLYSLCYVVFLIGFVAVLAVKSRGIRDNYREATYIFLSVGCTIPVWFVWTLSGLVVVSERHRDACLALGLIFTAGLTFLVMFTPKGRQLAAMGKDGVYMHDREDRFSSLSRGSGYSPSFFHFKPITKYHHHTTSGGKHPPPAAAAAVPAAPATITTLGGMFMRPDDANFYTSLEPTLSTNPNVYFHRGNSMHPGMMY